MFHSISVARFHDIYRDHSDIILAHTLYYPLLVKRQKKQKTKFCVQKFQKTFNITLYNVEKSKTRSSTVDLDEMAHYDLQCLQMQLLLCLAHTLNFTNCNVKTVT